MEILSFRLEGPFDNVNTFQSEVNMIVDQTAPGVPFDLIVSVDAIDDQRFMFLWIKSLDRMMKGRRIRKLSISNLRSAFFSGYRKFSREDSARVEIVELKVRVEGHGLDALGYFLSHCGGMKELSLDMADSAMNIKDMNMVLKQCRGRRHSSIELESLKIFNQHYLFPGQTALDDPVLSAWVDPISFDYFYRGDIEDFTPFVDYFFQKETKFKLKEPYQKYPTGSILDANKDDIYAAVSFFTLAKYEVLLPDSLSFVAPSWDREYLFRYKLRHIWVGRTLSPQFDTKKKIEDFIRRTYESTDQPELMMNEMPVLKTLYLENYPFDWSTLTQLGKPDGPFRDLKNIGQIDLTQRVPPPFQDQYHWGHILQILKTKRDSVEIVLRPDHLPRMRAWFLENFSTARETAPDGRLVRNKVRRLILRGLTSAELIALHGRLKGEAKPLGDPPRQVGSWFKDLICYSEDNRVSDEVEMAIKDIERLSRFCYYRSKNPFGGVTDGSEIGVLKNLMGENIYPGFIGEMADV